MSDTIKNSNGSLLLVHIMDGLGISRIVSSGDLYVNFEIFRDNQSVCNFRSKSIKNTRLMVWDEKIEKIFDNTDTDIQPNEENGAIIRISLMSSQTGSSSSNLEAFVEQILTTFVAPEEQSSIFKGNKGNRSRSPSPVRRIEKWQLHLPYMMV